MSIELVKKLREMTNAGFADCKTAIEEAKGNLDDAVKFLREKGKSAAGKKSGRETANGLVGFKIEGKDIAIVELACETDFVANGDMFQALLQELLDIAVKNKTSDLAKFLEENDNQVKNLISEKISVIGENIVLRKVTYKSSNHHHSAYVHNAAKNNPHMGHIVTVIEFDAEKDSEQAQEIAKKIAMHVTASAPVCMSEADVPAELIASEKSIYTEQAKATGKPDNVIEKMVTGRISKFCAEVAFLEQSFVMDPSVKIKDFVKKCAEDLKDKKFAIKSFIRTKLGE